MRKNICVTCSSCRHALSFHPTRNKFKSVKWFLKNHLSSRTPELCLLQTWWCKLFFLPLLQNKSLNSLLDAIKRRKNISPQNSSWKKVSCPGSDWIKVFTETFKKIWSIISPLEMILITNSYIYFKKRRDTASTPGEIKSNSFLREVTGCSCFRFRIEDVFPSRKKKCVSATYDI